MRQGEIMVKVMMTLLILCVSSHSNADLTPAMEKVSTTLNFSDDLNLENMLKAIARQEVYFQRRNLNEKVKFGKRTITREHLHHSLLRFKELVNDFLKCQKLYTSKICMEEMSLKLNSEFEIYRPLPLKWEKGYQTKQTFFTAYYSPDFEGSFVKTKRFRNPIYAMPKDSKLRKISSDQINYGNKLKGKGLELLYVDASLYDIWLLHVEGGGRVKVKQPDGTHKSYYLSYAGANGQKFQMLYRYMIDNGMLRKGEATIAKQREYFVNNPKRQREILNSCPSFIWFKITHDEPLGVHNMPLSENRSLATDYRRFKEYGVINFIKTMKPQFSNGQVSKVPFSRFMLNQDTGGAIKGNARVDVYFGYGPNAELAANHVYGLGNQYFLILK